MVYDLDPWPRNPINNFKFRNCLFGATIIVKTREKEKYVYSGYMDIWTGWWRYDNDTVKNDIIFGIDDSSSSNSENSLNNF